jgi:hypothetical protein
MTKYLENHPEWEKENSLTSPSDRDNQNRWRPEQAASNLSEDEVKQAMNELNNISFTSKFPRVDRTYADPPPPLQTIGLISFTPAKGAIPNDDGLYGFAKLRGNYSTQQEADQRAEYLIRNVDSYHQIYHCYVGRPFPITASSKYSAETTEIDIRKQMTESVSNDVKQKKMDEAKEIQEIKNREEALIAESKRDDVDPYDEYITLRVKKAQISWTYLEHIKKIKEIKEIILKTRTHIEKLDSENPEYKEKYFDKYMSARKESGFKDTKEELENNFLKFLVEDAHLPGIDETFLLEVPKVVEETHDITENDKELLDAFYPEKED